MTWITVSTLALGSLDNAGGFRQGSAKYIENGLNKYAEVPNANLQLVNDIRSQIRSERLESFASLYRADRLAQFNLKTFTDGVGANLNANKYFLNKNVRR